MSFLDQTTVLILTYDEQANIGRTLDAVASFSDVVVLDSGSTDDTEKIVLSYGNTRLVKREFDTHASQWNHGLSLCARPWVLALDADYVLPSALVEFMAALSPKEATGGYEACFRYCIFGHPLSASLYPSVVILFRRQGTLFVQDGHTQRVEVAGAIEALPYKVDHDDRKPMGRWFVSQAKYANLEAGHLLSVPKAELRRADRIRLGAWAAPILVFFYTLLIKRCVMEGRYGWFYVLQRVLAEIMLAIEVIDHRLRQTDR